MNKMTQVPKRFLLVDDDSISNFISSTTLKKSLGEVHIDYFTLPEDGLEFIKTGSIHHLPGAKTTLFLDLNMPTISGWEFLEAFEVLDESIKKRYNIYILSSSVDPNDVIRAKANAMVIDFIEKPLNRATVCAMFEL
jgi:response regulator RpfG family c-di-GMP phosphodiesterase